MSLEHQVPKSTLKNPICVAIFHNDGFLEDSITAQADELRRKLNELGIRFAAVNYTPPIKIFIEERDLPKVRKAGIRLPIVVDPR